MAAAAAAGGGGGGGSSRKSGKASKSFGRASSTSRASEDRDRSGGLEGEQKRANGAEGDGNFDDGSEYPLPKLHPTRSATREAVVRISDAVDPTVPDVPLDRNQAMSLIEKVAKRDREGVFRVSQYFYSSLGEVFFFSC